MEEPRYEPRAVFERLRGIRGFAAKAEGLWCAGPLEALAKPSVAIVGTRAATAYGRRLARSFARDLGNAKCCVVSGLALGIDASAHEGALDANGPTIGILGGGHHRFFPKRNAQLAQRMIGAGGAVISPFPPDHPAYPAQFLERNGIVAALADALVVIEAPARSGALNTASWAAGRIPVLAVPGDVDRPHVAGCLALIRDGAVLARSAGDVLEALHLPQTAPPCVASFERIDDPVAAALLDALEHGESELDELIAGSGTEAARVLSALTMLELEGRIERTGGGRYARVPR